MRTIKIYADLNKINYLIVNTGYTKRIIKKLGFDVLVLTQEVDSKGNLITDVSHSFDYKSEGGKAMLIKIFTSIAAFELVDQFNDNEGQPEDSDLERFLKGIVYIRDDNDKLFRFSKDPTEINKILRVTNNKGDSHDGTSGTICFRCTSRQDIPFYLKHLQSISYCHFGDYEGDMYLESDDLIITQASFDTEGG